MQPKLTPAIIVSLKHALSNIYWYKNDLRSFLNCSLKHTRVLVTVNWEETKFNCVSTLIDIMMKNQNVCKDDLLSLIKQVCNFNTFSHFDLLCDGEELKKKARNSIADLRKNCKDWIPSTEEKTAYQNAKKNYELSIKKNTDFQNALEKLKNDYYRLAQIENPQQRGFEFERFLNDLFSFFDLDPRKSFKIQGEQIDGAFTHEGTDYLIEAKWKKNPIERMELDVFSAKIQRKLKNTLGLFISVNSFSPTIIDGAINYNNMILMDSMDLIYVLENRISLTELIRLKRRHAAQTGEIMFRVNV